MVFCCGLNTYHRPPKVGTGTARRRFGKENRSIRLSQSNIKPTHPGITNESCDVPLILVLHRVGADGKEDLTDKPAVQGGCNEPRSDDGQHEQK